MLEGLLDRSEIRVGELVFAPPAKEVLDQVDPSVWAKKQTFNFIKTGLSDLETGNGAEYFLLIQTTRSLAAIKYLKPNLMPTLDLQNKLPAASLVELFNSDSIHQGLKRQTLEALSFLYPDFTGSPDLMGAVAGQLPAIKADFDDLVGDSNRMILEEGFIRLREEAIILKANLIPLNLPESFYEYAIRYYERSKRLDYEVVTNTNLMAKKATLFKVLYPDIPQTDYFTAEDLAFAKKGFKKQSENPKNSDFLLTQFAFNLKILASEKVDFTSQGIELVMAKPFFVPSTPIPEVRQF